MPDQVDKETAKAAVKEAMKEWADERIREFGWLLIKTIGGLAFAALAYYILTAEGWHK